jgi:hypothetical protein
MIYSKLSIEEKIKEIASIAVILGDHFGNFLYEHNRNHSLGYDVTVEDIGGFAIDFFNVHPGTDWSDGEHVWDDEVYLFGKKKVAEYIERG